MNNKLVKIKINPKDDAKAFYRLVVGTEGKLRCLKGNRYVVPVGCLKFLDEAKIHYDVLEAERFEADNSHVFDKNYINKDWLVGLLKKRLETHEANLANETIVNLRKHFTIGKKAEIDWVLEQVEKK